MRWAKINCWTESKYHKFGGGGGAVVVVDRMAKVLNCHFESSYMLNFCIDFCPEKNEFTSLVWFSHDRR